MASAEFRQQAARLKKALATKYEKKVKTSVAGPIGDGKIYLGGQIFDGSLTEVTRVVNNGRLASAHYVPQYGASSGGSTGGGSSTSTGTGTGTGTGSYLPLDGSLAMVGDLNMGSNSITNVQYVDGRDLQADGAVLDGIKNADIVTLSANANLVNERILTVSASLTLSDGGAGLPVILGMATPGTLTVHSTNDSTSAPHTHLITTDSNPGAQAMILATSTSGGIIVTTMGATTKVTTPLIDSALSLTLQPNTHLAIAPGAIENQVLVTNITIPGYVDEFAVPLHFTRLGSHNYASQTTGWAIDHIGAADFRYVYTDELHARAFIADLEQALAGSQIIAKSVTLLFLDFTAPAAGGSAAMTVRDLPSATGMAVFQDGDIIRVRQFSRSGGGLDISDCWGVVTLDTSYGTSGFDSETKSQRYTFVRSSVPNAGAMSAGTVTEAESIIIDYGTSGNGYYEVNAIDGIYAVNSPYAQVVTWTGHPHSGKTIKMRLGNLTGITDAYLSPTGYGLYSDNVYLRGSMAAANGQVIIDEDGIRIIPTVFSPPPDDGSAYDYNDINAVRFLNQDGGIVGGIWGGGGTAGTGSGHTTILAVGTSDSTPTNFPVLKLDSVGSYSGANQAWSMMSATSHPYVESSGQPDAHTAYVWLIASDTEATVRIHAGTDNEGDDGIIELRSPVYAYHDVLPWLGDDKNLGSPTAEWNTLYVNQIVVSGAISGDVLTGQEWEYPGSMTIDANSASTTTVTVQNSNGAGSVILNVAGTIQQNGTAVSVTGHTHSTYLLKAGDTITGNISVSSGVTIDGVDISAHAVDADAHHARAHSLTSASDHTVTGSQWQLLGLTATNTVGLLDSTDNPGAAAKILRTDATGALTVVQLTASTKVRTPLIDTASGGITLDPASGTVTVDGSIINTVGGGGTITYYEGDATRRNRIIMAADNVGAYIQSTYSAGGGHVLRFLGNVEFARFSHAGNFLIGTATDSGTYKLDVVGSIRASSNIDSGALVTGAHIGANISNPEGIQSNAGINEATRGASNVRMGVMGGYPRIILDNGSTESSWQIDNYASAFRIFRSGDVALTIDLTNGFDFYGDLASPDYVSQATGWRIDTVGGADFRYLYTTELHAKTFIADIEQALAGSQIITKSVTTLTTAYGGFDLPYPGGTAFLNVDDLPSAEGMQVFQNGDYVRLRQFSRSGGGLTIYDAWGTVTYVANLGNKAQRWAFTRSQSAVTYNAANYTSSPSSSTTSGSTSRSISKPSGTASGHFLLGFVVVANTSADITPPSGWTALGSGTVTGVKAALYYKVAGGSEPSSYTWNFSTSTAASVTIANYSNVHGIAFGGVNEVSTASTGFATLDSTYRSPKDTFIVFSGFSSNVRATPSSGLTELIDAGTSGIGSYMAHQTASGPGIRASIGGTAASSVRSVTMSVHLSPPFATGSTDAVTGYAGPGSGISDGTLVLDYGVAGNGYVETTTVDGIYGANSPYQRIATWHTHPSAPVVRTQMGNLYGLFGIAGEFGFYAGSGTSIADAYVRLSSHVAEFRNIPINIYESTAKRMEIIPSGGLNFRVDTAGGTANSQVISWYSDLDAKSATARAYLYVYTYSTANRMLMRVTDEGVTEAGMLFLTPTSLIGLNQYEMGGSGSDGTIYMMATGGIYVSAPSGINLNGADIYGADHILASSGTFGTHYAYDQSTKGVRVYGSGYDTSRYYAGAIGFNLAWNASAYRFGTDGGTNGGILMLAEGSGDTLTIYTRPDDGGYSSTLSDSALTSLKRLTLNHTGMLLSSRLAVGGSGYSSGLVVVESASTYSGITSVFTATGGSPGSAIRALGSGLAPTAYDFYSWYSSYGPTQGGLRAGTSTGYWSTVIWSDGALTLRAGGYADNNSYVNIISTGNVGIGTGGPAYKLDVNGAVHASSFPTSSDERFKEALVPLSDVLDKVGQLGTYNFYWRKNYAAYNQFLDKDGKPVLQIGFVAQEVEQYFPELISHWTHTGNDGETTNDAYSVDYARMVTVLVQALRELRAEKDAEVRELRALIQAKA